MDTETSRRWSYLTTALGHKSTQILEKYEVEFMEGLSGSGLLGQLTERLKAFPERSVLGCALTVKDTRIIELQCNVPSLTFAKLKDLADKQRLPTYNVLVIFLSTVDIENYPQHDLIPKLEPLPADLHVIIVRVL
jgi:hypothetical protein